MASYSFQIRKADHVAPDGTADLHVHVYYNEGKRRKLLGRYRLPSLQPVFADEPQLKEKEQRILRDWLAQPEQINKLQNCLRSTMFDLHKVVSRLPEFSDITTDQGETYIQIRVPVARRFE